MLPMSPGVARHIFTDTVASGIVASIIYRKLDYWPETCTEKHANGMDMGRLPNLGRRCAWPNF